ncbi:MAG TPA: OmpH family outer membrane protein [bacterium]|nr:OmpH family outer membrane protein [bacterium]
MRSITFAVLFLLTSAVFAHDFKTAVVDMSQVFNEYPGTQRAKEKLAKWEKQKTDDLSDAYQELNDLNKELTGKSAISAKMKAKKQREFDEKFAEYKKRDAQIRNEISDKESAMTLALVDEIKPIVAEVAKQKDVDLVLDSSKVVYNASQVDLTKDILERFKKMKDDSDDKK